jgi:NTP pyrophosphatase (non-canonical NTP hydrolase)
VEEMNHEDAIKCLEQLAMGADTAIEFSRTKTGDKMETWQREADALRMGVRALRREYSEDADKEQRQLLVDYIREYISGTAMLAQIAEEAAELSHAASKLIRVIDGTNPTPTGSREAVLAIREEFGDVLNACAVYGVTPYSAQDDANDKLNRWAWRIKCEVENGEE